VSKKYGNPQSAEEYLRASWEEQQHIEEEYSAVVDIILHPTTQRGVYCFHFDANGPVLDVGLLVPLARYKATYPNGVTKEMGAHIFGGLLKLGNMVAEFRAKSEEERAR